MTFAEGRGGIKVNNPQGPEKKLGKKKGVKEEKVIISKLGTRCDIRVEEVHQKG